MHMLMILKMSILEGALKFSREWHKRWEEEEIPNNAEDIIKKWLRSMRQSNR